MQLRQTLNAELARLGVDPAKVAAAAPTGADNAVFDLAATVIDPDGPPDGEGGGELPSTGIELTWTERFIGDYDQNGEVNYADITPLGLNFNALVDYDDPALHGGFAAWPTGDPEDDGGASPPTPGSGAANWRLARIDGEPNGELNFGDVTSLAVHWQERLSGYRVFCRDSTGTPFVQIAQVPRPVVMGNEPARYSFRDQPELAGSYEYYVIPFSESEGQGAHGSNTVIAELGIGFADTSPPVWDSDVGITSASDNGNGTITVTWGHATDVAEPHAEPHEPVTYNIYYSTSTPLELGGATQTASTGSPWTSPQLIAGKTYYFCVRARDSASPPNEDQNTVEMSVTVTGDPVEDSDPPVWIEKIKKEGEEQYPIKGIKEFEILDGKLRITHALAEDVLNPPVHYDLYYMQIEHELGSIFYTEGELEGQIRSEATLVEDIPPVYDLICPNRRHIVFLVRARDSADPPNYDDNDLEWASAPSPTTRTILDSNFPGLNPATLSRDSDYDIVADPFTHKFYYGYVPMEHESAPNEVWFIELDADTASWTSRLIHSRQDDEAIYDSITLGRSWTGDIWVRWASKFGDGPVNIHFEILRQSGVWESWDADSPSQLIDLRAFDHNGNPAYFDISPSAVQSGRFKSFFNWWDGSSREWKSELAYDPGGTYCQTFRRPDGVLQVVMQGESHGPGDTDPVSGRILERSPDGTWELKYEVVGAVGASTFPATWGLPVEWSGGANHNWEYHETFIYNQSGYKFMPDIPYEDEIVGGRLWDAGGGKFHGLPNYIYKDGSYIKQHLYGSNMSREVYLSDGVDNIQTIFRHYFLYDPFTGFYAQATFEPDLHTRQYEFVLRTLPPGESLFDP